MGVSNQSNGLRFDVYERVHLPDDVAAINELEEIELVPRIQIFDQGDQAVIKGQLMLTGVYRGQTEAEGPLALEHWIPVEISLPMNRVTRLDDISIEIDNFDVDLLSARTLNITGVLSLRGISVEPADEQQEPWEEEAFTAVHQREAAEAYRQEPVHEPVQEQEQTADGGPYAYGAYASELWQGALREGENTSAEPQAGAEEAEEPDRQPEAPEASEEHHAGYIEASAEAAEAEEEGKPRDTEPAFQPLAEPEAEAGERLQPSSPYAAAPAYSEPSGYGYARPAEQEPGQEREPAQPYGQAPQHEQGQAAAPAFPYSLAGRNAVPAEEQAEPELASGEPAPASLPERENGFSGIAAEPEPDRLPTDPAEPLFAPEPAQELRKQEVQIAFASKTAGFEEEGAGFGFRALLQSSKREQAAREAAEHSAAEKEAEEESRPGPAEDEIEWKKLFLSKKQDDNEFRKIRVCIVQKEETLESIAMRYSINPRELLTHNKLHESSVTEGQLLYIP